MSIRAEPHDLNGQTVIHMPCDWPWPACDGNADQCAVLHAANGEFATSYRFVVAVMFPHKGIGLSQREGG
jgi:hypothetical protein